MDKIRLGVIGAGGNTKARHIPLLKAIRGVEIVSVCNRSQASGEKVAREFGIPKVVTSWHEIVEDPDLDGVVIGTWPDMHCLLSCSALHEGKHVLCEARMARDADEAHQMLEASRVHPELVAQIVPSPFTFDYDATLQKLVTDGFLGELLAVTATSYGGQFVNREAAQSWRQDFAISGLNIMGMGIFYEALARWVGHASRVQAMGKVAVKQRRRADGSLGTVRIPDHLEILAELEIGAQLRMTVSQVCGLAPGGTEFWLFGSEGTVKLDLASKQILVGKRGDTALKPIEIAAADRGHWRVEEEFIGAIRGTEKIKYTTFEEGVRYMEFTEAVSRSMAGGKVVPLPLGV
jgi:predicted dehydrogenase